MNGLTLNRVVVLARHGARSSTYTIEQFGCPSWSNGHIFRVPEKIEQINYTVTGVNSGPPPPKYDIQYLPCGGVNGRLSNRGYLGNYSIGRHIAKTYGKFAPDDVYVRSTNFKRTIESARSIYAGIMADDTTSLPDSLTIEVMGDLVDECLTTHTSCRDALRNYAWIWVAGGMHPQMRPLLLEAIRVLRLTDTPNIAGSKRMSAKDPPWGVYGQAEFIIVSSMTQSALFRVFGQN